ncbi:nematode resistance protein-like HSPRO2 [Quillaja saponaria]|uniref:Nematode resistance protein-like HSPRO2 n=1 Tax=Quillaja saponaria TaxID=32244 RepID=A0AAD7LTR5_QUISA|nr:nematode resistance protein-like HSPRO2 [Quillaja saponaria]
MVDLDWKSEMVSPSKSPKLSDKLQVSVPSIPLPFRATDISAASSSVCSAYEHYLRLPELRKLWSSKEFPNWKNESVLKPALQALEITFRFISTALLDPRQYINRRELKRRLELLATTQIEIIAILCEDDEEDRGVVPTIELSSSSGDLALYSQASSLPHLATWQRSKDVGQKILCSIECEMRRCPYTLGLGEANLSAKPNLRYDIVCKPDELHRLNKSPYDQIENYENQTVYTTHQILESWVYVSHQLLNKITENIENKSFEKASNDCYMIERIWKLLADIEDLHLLMDPEDFLRLKNQLSINTSWIQEAAMKLYVDKSTGFQKIHLLQALQAIESAMKRFFYAYKQVLVVVMGSLEAKGNRVALSSDSCDSLSQIFLEPTYFPSLDAAKTFLGYFLG